MKKALIIAAGSFDLNFFLNFIRKKPSLVIALDGAANSLVAYFKTCASTADSSELLPHFIIGDFDSISPESITFLQNKTTLLHDKDQNSTDLEKGIRLALAQNCKQIEIIFGLEGERTDHYLSNLSLLKRFHRPQDYEICFYHHQEKIQYLENQAFIFEGAKDSIVGLFGFPSALCTSKGLVWELENYPLKIGESWSSSNRIREKQVRLQLQGQALLIKSSEKD